MRILNYRKSFFLLLSISVVVIDQLSKYLLTTNYNYFYKQDFILINFEYVKNYGAAFNIFSGSRLFLSSVSVVFSIILLYLILRNTTTKNIDLYSYSFILGGTLGNGIDRILKGFVIDFIKINYINFPIFNVADISINIGFLIILYSLVKLNSKDD
tara:strand:- start:77 stop:544 length:468 start_codon:yes stop_codon:yes gene_type:complete